MAPRVSACSGDHAYQRCCQLGGDQGFCVWYFIWGKLIGLHLCSLAHYCRYTKSGSYQVCSINSHGDFMQFKPLGFLNLGSRTAYRFLLLFFSHIFFLLQFEMMMVNPFVRLIFFSVKYALDYLSKAYLLAVISVSNSLLAAVKSYVPLNLGMCLFYTQSTESFIYTDYIILDWSRYGLDSYY